MNSGLWSAEEPLHAVAGQLASERRRDRCARRRAAERIVGWDRERALAVEQRLLPRIGDAELDRQAHAVNAPELVRRDRRLRQRDDPRFDRVALSEGRPGCERVDERRSQCVRDRGLRDGRADGRDREPAPGNGGVPHVVPAAPEGQGDGEGDVDRGSEPPENRGVMGDRRALLAVALVLTPRESWGQEPAVDPAPAPIAEPAVDPAPVDAAPKVEPELRRAYAMQANIRVRYLSVPNSVMDLWFFDSDDAGANPLDRPNLRAYAVGAEWVIDKAPANWIFYGEWVGNATPAGYWDDVESSPADHSDGSWLEPDAFGMVVLGANYGHGIPIREWLDFLFGGGLGLGFVTGEVTVWNGGGNEDVVDATCLRTSAAYERQAVCEDDGPARVPGLVPLVDLTASARFAFTDQATVRLDAGFHNVLYVGTAFGVVF